MSELLFLIKNAKRKYHLIDKYQQFEILNEINNNLKTFNDTELYNIVKYLKLKLNMNIMIDIFNELLERKSPIIFNIYDNFGIYQTNYMYQKLLKFNYGKTILNINTSWNIDHYFNKKDLDNLKVIKFNPGLITDCKISNLVNAINNTITNYLKNYYEWKLINNQPIENDTYDYFIIDMDPYVAIYPKQLNNGPLFKVIEKRKISRLKHIPKKYNDIYSLIK